MSGLKELKGRINSVKKTGQMTKAMKMVSVARLRSAQNRILSLRAYANGLEDLLKDVILSQNIEHPFFEIKKDEELKKVLTVIVTSDRGLCGAFNGNTCRFAEEQLKNKNQDLFFVGKKGHDYFKFRGVKAKGLIVDLVKEISYPLSARIAKELMDKILLEDYDGVFVIYNEFKNVISPRLVCDRFLPFDLLAKQSSIKELCSLNMLFEVSPQELMDSLLTRYFSIQVYRYLCENIAAEQGSRMAAMENASKNAEDLTKTLTLKYNKLRQSSITTELSELVAGAESLK